MLLYPHTCRLAGVVGPAGQALTLHSSKTPKAQTGPLSQNSITRVDPELARLLADVEMQKWLPRDKGTVLS